MTSNRRLLAALALVALLGMAAGPAHAYRFIQNTSVGRTSSGFLVTCSDPVGFTHWGNAAIPWYHNTAGQGSGKQTAIQNALQSWTNVAGAPHTLTYAGTTTAGFVTDNRNTVLWARGNGCTGSCLAITALVLASGQVITETDISFNSRYAWNTNGSAYDVEAVMAHELGHTLGLHHTEITSLPRPTMYASYFGTDGRSLESDDTNALQCSANRYPPATQQAIAQFGGRVVPGAGTRPVAMTSRARTGGAVIRFALRDAGPVQLRVYDVAGREIATLLDGERAAGDHELAWGGEGAFGRVSSGMYFARLTSPSGVATATVILAE